MSISPKVLLVGLVLGLGMVYSVYDYRQWRQAEFSQLGQGAQNVDEFQAAVSLDKWYQNQELGVRLAYPAGWDVVESQNLNKLITVGDGQVKVVLSSQASKLSVTDEINKLTNLPPFLNDREYINTDTAHLVIVTWEEGPNTFQRAYGKNEDNLLILESMAPTSSWKLYAKTLWTMYESMVLF